MLKPGSRLAALACGPVWGCLEGKKYKSQEDMIKALRSTKGGQEIIERVEQGQGKK